jgi:hypothetical protein
LTKGEKCVIINTQRKNEVNKMFSVENEIKKACPVCDMDCPYFALGYCKLENPQEECDDYAMYWESEENE